MPEDPTFESEPQEFIPFAGAIQLLTTHFDEIALLICPPHNQGEVRLTSEITYRQWQAIYSLADNEDIGFLLRDNNPVLIIACEDDTNFQVAGFNLQALPIDVTSRHMAEPPGEIQRFGFLSSDRFDLGTPLEDYTDLNRLTELAEFMTQKPQNIVFMPDKGVLASIINPLADANYNTVKNMNPQSWADAAEMLGLLSYLNNFSDDELRTLGYALAKLAAYLKAYQLLIEAIGEQTPLNLE